MKQFDLKILKVTTYIEDYCCVVSFASDDSPNPDYYLILTRQSSKINGGEPIEDFEWDMFIDYSGDINLLTGYKIHNSNIVFYFDTGRFALNLNIAIQEIEDLDKWLSFIFKKTKVSKFD